MSDNLYSMIQAAGRGQGKLRAYVRDLYQNGSVSAVAIEAAQTVESKLPVRKVDGKDVNRAERNNLLSILRATLRHAAKDLEVKAITVKTVEGVWQAAAVEPRAPSEPGNPTSEKQADQLWAAAEIVANAIKRGDAAIVLAVRDALNTLASAAHQ